MTVRQQLTAYLCDLQSVISEFDLSAVAQLAQLVADVRDRGGQVLLCGNGGSGANAIHIANDMVGVGPARVSKPIRAWALSANQSVITCLGNDIGYDYIFSEQLSVHGQEGDLLIALSGSGNSKNIISAIAKAHELGMSSVAITGYDGGAVKNLVKLMVHVPVEDMQIAEDFQLIIGHMVMRSLY